MPDSEFLDVKERKRKIRKHVKHLSDRFNKSLFSSPEKVRRIERMKPNFQAELHERWTELDRRYFEYLEGKIDWDGETLQMELMPLSGVAFPRLEIQRDVLNYGRDLFCWFELQIKDL